MDLRQMEQVLRNLDQRVARIEQILPTLATREELQRAIQGAIAPLATREELQRAIQGAIAPLATKSEVEEVRLTLRHEMREEGARTRAHFDAVAERLEDHVRLIADGLAVLTQNLGDFRREHQRDIAGLDQRLIRLEAGGAR